MPTKRATYNLITFKSCDAFLRMLLVCIRSSHPDILYLREQGYEDPWLFFGTKRDP
jgi:hypothetical protein